MDAQEIQDSSSSNLVNVRRLRTAVAMAIIRTARREGSIETGYQMALRMYSAEIRKQQNTLELYKRIITGEDNKVDTGDNGDDTYSENIDSNNKLESLPITCNYVPTRKRTKFTIASNHRNTTFQFNPPSRRIDEDSAVLHIRSLLNYGLIQTHNQGNKRFNIHTTERSIELLYKFLNKYMVKFKDNYEIIIQFSNLLISSFCESSFKFEDDHQLVIEVECLLNINVIPLSHICNLISILDHICDNVAILKEFTSFPGQSKLPLFELNVMGKLLGFSESILFLLSSIELQPISKNLKAALDKLITTFQTICNDLQLHLNDSLPLIVLQMNSQLINLQKIVKDL